MGHDSGSFWCAGMRDFKRSVNAYMKANGIERQREITPAEFDSQYARLAEKLKRHDKKTV